MNEEELKLHNKLTALFREESAEHLKTLYDGLFALEKSPPKEDWTEIVQSLFRAAHSLKGASRAISFYEVEGLCATMEDVLDALKNGKVQAEGNFLETLLEAAETLEGLIANKTRGEDLAGITVQSTNALTEKLAELIVPKNDDKKAVQVPAGEREVEEPPQNIEDSPETSRDRQPRTREKERIAKESIRVSANKIDRLLQHAEEMLMIKLSSKQRVKEFEVLQQLLNEWHKDSVHRNLESSFQELSLAARYNETGSPAQLPEFLNHLNLYFERKKELFTALSEKIGSIGRTCDKDHRMACSLVDSVIEDTKDILMQPFSSLLDMLPRMARELGQSLQKHVTVEICGDEIEVDRRILEKLKDPMIHLLRNCIDHGIEPPDEREKLGKHSKGIVKIQTKQISGNTFEISLSDDGRGIDFEQVKEKARREGLLTDEEYASPEPKDLTRILFKPGFTTSQIVTDISGRGIGLNVLSENIEKLGGTVAVTSEKGKGTKFVITMPLTLATFRGIHLKAAGQDFIIPTHNVVRVLRMLSGEIKSIESRQALTVENETFSYVELSAVLGLPAADHQPNNELQPVLIIKAYDTRIAFGVDAILSEQEVFVKGLGEQLQRVPNIAATTIMEWGKVIPILDPFDLIKSAAGTVERTKATSGTPLQEESEQKAILIVEDSITSRMLLKNILESAGYLVKSAVDGLEGLEKIQKEAPDLVLSDVEMPRMDGFELTAKIRSTDKWKNIPVILCTSRGSKKDREHGIKVGASAYLDKSNFKQKSLLDIVKQLVR